MKNNYVLTKAKNLYRRLSIQTKIRSLFLIFLAFTTLALYWAYNQQVKKTFDDTHSMMMNSLRDISEIMSMVSILTDSGFTQTDYEMLKPYFDERKYFETGYPFLVNRQGDFLLHPWKEGTNELNAENHIKRLSYGEGSGYFQYLFSIDGRVKWQYISYFKPYDFYLVVNFYQEELFRGLTKQIMAIIFSLILGIILFILSNKYTINPIFNAIKRVKTIIGDIADGKVTKKINVHRPDEIGDMTQSIDQLIVEIEKKAHFSDEIAKGNLNAQLSLISNEDILGKSLINMRDKLVAAQEIEKRQQIEIEKQNWVNQGLTVISDILRQDFNNIDELSYKIIGNLVTYIGVNIGGVFMVNSDADDTIIEMVACYAYNCKRLEKKTLSLGEGLVGECVLEKDKIHIKKLPNNYINIASGLGESSPKELLIIPLKTDNEVIGAIELASLSEIEPHAIELVEKVSETIASTIVKMKANLKTEQLLEQTNSQAMQMKAQEEELRQNMEEMQSTQEQMRAREEMLIEELEKITAENQILIEKVNALKHPEEST
ncbi:MAG TPA: GAF domain-containing protein [Salinivirgaceae bacterium]|nr:GAF domain-containing protein [Salinivirgaceae bacterium]HQA76107.1 GAF domain-containing protein [Salinivirgaceae bacterium]